MIYCFSYMNSDYPYKKHKKSAKSVEMVGYISVGDLIYPPVSQ